MPAIRISRPKREWSVSPATVLPAALLLRLIKAHPDYTVLLDGHPVGRIGVGQVQTFDVAAGEHRVRMRFIQLRRSAELRVSLTEDEERALVCGTSGLGWPTLREASPEEVPGDGGTSIGEPPTPGSPAPPN